MSGSELNRSPAGLSGVLSATSTFRGYRSAAIVTYVISDIALLAAAVAYFVSGLAVALAIGVVAIVFTLVALRCGQIVFARNTYEDRIPEGETLDFEFGARRAVPLSTLRSPVIVLATDRAVHAYLVGLIPSQPIASALRDQGVTLRRSPTARSGDAELTIGSQSIVLRGLSEETFDRTSALLG